MHFSILINIPSQRFVIKTKRKKIFNKIRYNLDIILPGSLSKRTQLPTAIRSVFLLNITKVTPLGFTILLMTNNNQSLRYYLNETNEKDKLE